MQPTAMYRTLTEYLRLGDIQANAWRLALAQAQWSEPQAWARDVQNFDLSPPHGADKLARVIPFFQEVSPPSRVVSVIESLVQEGLLTRREGTWLEEHVFQCVDHQGKWVWDV
jgi:hypothetical protein